MTDFNLTQFDVTDRNSVKYPITSITMNDKTPWLMVKPATESNKAFAKAQLLRSNKRARTTGARGGITLESLDANRADDRELYPLFIITGWGDVFDTNKKPVEFNQKVCKEFIAQLPAWIFDDLRVFCSQASNFINTEEGLVDNEAVGN